MSLSAALPQISTNVRFAASRLLFPELASSLAERLFLTPPRARDAAGTALDLIDARSSIAEHKGRSIVTWRWGSRRRRLARMRCSRTPRIAGCCSSRTSRRTRCPTTGPRTRAW